MNDTTREGFCGRKVLDWYQEFAFGTRRPTDLVLRDLLTDLRTYCGPERFDHALEEARTLGRERD